MRESATRYRNTCKDRGQGCESDLTIDIIASSGLVQAKSPERDHHTQISKQAAEVLTFRRERCALSRRSKFHDAARRRRAQ